MKRSSICDHDGCCPCMRVLYVTLQDSLNL